MSTPRRLLLALAGAAFLAVPSVRAEDRDPLPEVRDRMKVEAQRVEKEFADGRSAAYKLVRNDDPKLAEATEKLHTLLAMVRNDNSLEPRRRAVLIVTLKADLDRVRDIADQRRRFTARSDDLPTRAVRADSGKADDVRRAHGARRVGDEARSIVESRGRGLADARMDRGRFNDRFTRALRSVDESAVPETRDMRFPKNWAELSKKRSPEPKLTAKEKAIMKSLGDTLDVEFSNNGFQEVIDYLKKKMGVEIVVDQRALQEVSVTSESPVSLKIRASGRTVLKRVLADLGLAYVIKDETILVTSRERANQMTTTRTYYLGGLVALVDTRLPPALTQLAMLENANRLVTLIIQS